MKSFVLATLCQTMGGTLTIFTCCWLKLGDSIFTYIGLINFLAVFCIFEALSTQGV